MNRSKPAINGSYQPVSCVSFCVTTKHENRRDAPVKRVFVAITEYVVGKLQPTVCFQTISQSVDDEWFSLQRREQCSVISNRPGLCM